MSTCNQCGEDKSVDACVSCGKLVCRQHAGHLKNYVSLEGRKGRGCNLCISEGWARPEYSMIDMHLVVPDALRRLEHKLYPRAIHDITALTNQTKQETFAEARTLVRELEESIQRASESLTSDFEDSAGRIVSDTLEQARTTLRELTGEITNAISHQRIEVKSDAEKIVHEIRESVREAINEASVVIDTALQRAALILVAGAGGVAIVVGLLLRLS